VEKGLAVGLLAALLMVSVATAGGVPLLVRQRTLPDGVARPVGPFTKALVGFFEKETRLRFDLKPYPWRRAVALGLHGDGVLWGLPAEADDSDRLVFSRPVYTTHVWMVVRRKDRLTINGLDDLQGKVVSAFGGSRYSAAFELQRGKLFQVEEDPDSIGIRLRKLALGRVDVVLLHSRHDHVDQVKSGLEAEFAETDADILPVPLEDIRICFAAARGGPYAALLPQLDKAIERGHATRRLERLVADT
jgi:hypothetical protein